MLPDMTSASQQQSEINCFVPASPYTLPDSMTMLQQMSGGGFDMILADMNSTFHHQSLVSCFVPVPSCSHPYPLSPVSPLAPALPYLYSPNDSGLVNIGDASPTSQSPGSPNISGSSSYCDIPLGYGSPYPFVINTCPMMPMSKSSPSEVESRSELLNSATGESNGVVRCIYKHPTVTECSSPYHVPPPCPPVSQGEEKIKETSKEECTGTLSVTGLFPECTEKGPPGPPTPAPAVVEVKEGEQPPGPPTRAPAVEEVKEGEQPPGPPTRAPAVVEVKEGEYDGNKKSKFEGLRADVYWHPFAEDINESSLDTVTANSSHPVVNCLKENSPEQQQHDVRDIRSLPFIPPVLPHMMPPPPYGIMLPPRQKTFPLMSKPQPRDVPLPPFYNTFHHVDLPESLLGRPRLLHTLCKENHPCVEEIWKMHMVLLFKNFPDEWVLNAVSTSNKYGSNWSSFKDLAKVRFYCRGCHDGWTSMYGVVVFYYKLNCSHPFGQILYDVPGQKCRNCKPKLFEVPMWYPEEAQKVITNLYYKIAADCYNLTTPQFIRSRRQGQPLTFHNELLCEGCCNGVCKNDCNKEDE